MLAQVYKTGAIIARFSRRSSAGAGSNGGLHYAPPGLRHSENGRFKPRISDWPRVVIIGPTAPNAEVTVNSWKEPPELKARRINRVHTFLKAH